MRLRDSDGENSLTMTKPIKQPYHHGDLAPVLMALALDDIAENGIENLSLRALARKAEVSQTAPYRHFADKTSLLAALATQGFTQLHALLVSASQKSSSTADQLLEIGVAYVNFAVENPVIYQLMFGRVVADFSKHTDLRTAAQNCFKLQQGLLDALIAEKQLDHDRAQLNGIVWSALHGTASLLTRVRPTDYGNKVGSRDATAAVSRDVRGSLRILFSHLLD